MPLHMLAGEANSERGIERETGGSYEYSCRNSSCYCDGGGGGGVATKRRSSRRDDSYSYQ